MAKKDPNKNLQKYLNRIEAAEKYRDNGYKELWTRCYKRWRNYVDALLDPETGKEVKDRSNISIPYSFVQVETILPRLVETLFATRPYITVKDREPSDRPNAQRNETLLDWQMNERMDIQDIFHVGLKGCLIYGTAIAYTGWKLEQKEIIKKQLMPIDIDGNPVLRVDENQIPLIDDYTGEPVQDWFPMRINEIEYDDPEVKFIDLGLFYVDPAAEDIDDARYCGHITYETKEQLQKKADLGIYKIDWKKVPKDSKGNKARDYRMSSVGLPSTDDQVPENDDDYLYEVLHYWEDDKHVVILNRSYIAFEGDNPYWHKKKPYRKGVYTVVPHEFYGMGIIEMVEDLQDELNTERNMRIDFRAFLLRRMFKVRRGANINKKELKWRQGGIIYLDDMDDVQEMGIRELPNSSFPHEQTIKQDMQDATGAHDVIIGTSNSNETATSTMTKDNNASMRFKLVISNLEKKLLVGVARFMIQLNQQFIDNERVLRITGENGDSWTKITPEEIQGEFDLIAAGTSVEPLANKEAYKQRLVELYGIAKQDPIYNQFPEKRVALLKKVFEAFDIKDTEALLPTDQEMQIMNQNTQMLQQLTAEKEAQLNTSPQGALNTAAQTEQGLQMAGGGGY